MATLCVLASHANINVIVKGNHTCHRRNEAQLVRRHPLTSSEEVAFVHPGSSLGDQGFWVFRPKPAITSPYRTATNKPDRPCSPIHSAFKNQSKTDYNTSIDCTALRIFSFRLIIKTLNTKTKNKAVKKPKKDECVISDNLTNSRTVFNIQKKWSLLAYKKSRLASTINDMETPQSLRSKCYSKSPREHEQLKHLIWTHVYFRDHNKHRHAQGKSKR